MVAATDVSDETAIVILKVRISNPARAKYNIVNNKGLWMGFGERSQFV